MAQRILLTIRQATADDLDLISRIVSDAARDGIAPTLNEQGATHLLSAMTSQKMRERFESGRFLFFIGEADESVAVGCVRLPTHLYYLFVNQAQRGQGIGRALWEHSRALIHELAEETVTEITVNSSLNAVAVYERFGFAKAGLVEEQNGVRFQPMVYRETNGR